MWCLPCCFKPSTSEDRFEAETGLAIQVSQREAEERKAKQHDLAIQEAEHLDFAIQESSRLRQLEEERRTRELEKDAQIANGLLYEERERQINNKPALEDEQISKSVLESLKEKSKTKLFEEQVKNDEQLALVVQESLKENNKRKQFEEQVKDDEQFALAVQASLNMVEYPSSVENNKSKSLRAPYKQLPKVAEESLKVKGKGKQFDDDHQVENDKQHAMMVQERLNMVEYPTPVENNKSNSLRAPFKQLPKVAEESLKVKGKGKQFDDDLVENDKQHALMVQESLNMVKSPPRLEEFNKISTTRAPLDEDVQRVIWESLKENGQIKQSKDEVEEDEKLPNVNPPRSLCGGCTFEVELERSVNISGLLWHPGCYCCRSCDKPIAIIEGETHVSNARGKFHKICYERYCYVCGEKKLRTFNHHPFWKEDRYCPAHETDGTHKCCSCERFEHRETNYVMLGDGRWLCLECMDSSVMDSDECQPLHFDMREFYEGLNMKIDKQFPFLLVERQALNKAEKEEKIDYQYEVVTRGICLSEEQIVDSVTRKPVRGPNNKLIGMATEPQKVVRECEVTAVLILYGLPRLLTGYILAHEMMHAYLRLNGHRNLDNVLEEGICQVLGHMWLESQTYASADATVNATSEPSSSRTPPAASASKKGEWSDFEKKLVGFCKHQIETDESPVYGLGFRTVNEMVTNSSLHDTVKFIVGG